MKVIAFQVCKPKSFSMTGLYKQHLGGRTRKVPGELEVSKALTNEESIRKQSNWICWCLSRPNLIMFTQIKISRLALPLRNHEELIECQTPKNFRAIKSDTHAKSLFEVTDAIDLCNSVRLVIRSILAHDYIPST